MNRILTYLFIAASAALPSTTAQDVWDTRPGEISGSGSRVPEFASYAGGRFLLAGTSSAFWTSASGTGSWVETALPSPPSGYSSEGIATDGNVVLVSGRGNTIYRTTAASIAGLPDTPISWTQINPLSRDGGLGRVRYINGQFIVTTESFIDNSDFSNSYSEILTSPDGITWTSHQFLRDTQGTNLFNGSDIAFKPGDTPGTGVYVVVSSNTRDVYFVPEDFSQLTRVRVTGASANGATITYGEGQFVLATTGGKIFTATDGFTFSQKTLPGTPTLFNEIFHDGTTFVVVGRQTLSGASKPMILQSPDGLSWSTPTTFDFSGTFNNRLAALTKADGLWITVGNQRDLFTSGISSVGPPVIDPLSAATAATAGGNITISATVNSSPAATSFSWQKDGTPLSNGTTPDGSVISGADTDTLTITGVTLADAGAYALAVTNSVDTTTSNASSLSVSVASNGAIFTPYGLDNSLGGQFLTGSTPEKSMVGVNTPATFTVGGGVEFLPNIPADYQYYGAVNQSGTKILLGNQFALAPMYVYDLTTETGAFLPDITFPIGPVNSASTVLPSAIADNGDVGGVINDTSNQLYAFHYSAATQTYTILGNVPNAGNEIATSIGGITSDGTTLSGYERNSTFNGPFVWTTTGGFTLLPSPENGSAVNGDIRHISPNGRFTVGFGTASNGAGGGQTAMRWDRNSGSPVGFALTKTLDDTFADARWVTDDGTTVGNVRRGFLFTDNKAAVWLPNGALVMLQDYLSARYGLTISGYDLTQVTSISPDRRTLTGTASKSSGFAEGWILTLPDPIEAISLEPDVSFSVNTTRTNGSTFTFGGSIQIDGGLYPSAFAYISNLGSDSLNVSSVTFSGGNAGDFELIEVPSGGLTGSYGINEIRSFKVRFNPQPGAEGTRTAILTIASNDPDAAAFVMNFSGSATSPPLPTPAEAALATYLEDANVSENLRGPLDDPDSDGVNNLLEFALGLPPMSFSPQPSPVNSGGVLSLTYTRSEPAHVTYLVTVTSDLGVSDPWSATGVTQGTPDGNGETTATIPVIATPRFLRLEVQLAP